jgi:hypothetical protein
VTDVICFGMKNLVLVDSRKYLQNHYRIMELILLKDWLVKKFRDRYYKYLFDSAIHVRHTCSLVEDIPSHFFDRSPPHPSPLQTNFATTMYVEVKGKGVSIAAKNLPYA